MKDKRFKAIGLLVAVWLVAFIGLISSWKDDNVEKDIVTAFAPGNYIKTNGTVSVYVNYGNRYLSYDAKKELIINIAKSLGIKGELNIETSRQYEEGDTSAIEIASYVTTTDTSVTDIRIVTIENISQDNMVSLEQYITVDVSIENSIESAVYYEQKLRDAFNDLGMSADVTLSLEGSIKGAISNAKKNQICEEIIEGMDGELVIGGSSDDIYTVYAYTEKIEDYVVNGTTKSNINIVISYDEINDETWIYVATPIYNQ
ncbi:MAG: YwmB family TATA-box binding protein [Lachnospiraceae bacterium]|nr:YwmB family TATA-box binding protein [Lachnospiraceae bacterium]